MPVVGEQIGNSVAFSKDVGDGDVPIPPPELINVVERPTMSGVLLLLIPQDGRDSSQGVNLKVGFLTSLIPSDHETNLGRTKLGLHNGTTAEVSSKNTHRAALPVTENTSRSCLVVRVEHRRLVVASW
ncbi:hypothetical protein LINPERHAP2_LOCUS7800 [Linum perenne]